MADQPLPDWYAPEEAAAPIPTPQQVQVPARVANPDWYTPEAENVTVTATKPESAGQEVGDLAANVATGVGRIPGAIVGVPHSLAHAANWIYAQLGNAWNGVKPDGTWRQGADYDESNPLTKHTLSSEDVDKHVFDTLGVKPYEPESFVGKLLQAGVTGAGAGAIDPFALLGAVRSGATGAQALSGAIEGMAGRAGKMAVASDAANATQQVFPDDPELAAGAALLAHSGVGTGAAAATKGYRTFVEPLVNPQKAAETFAGNKLSRIDNRQPGMADPSNADLDNAKDATRTAVNDIGTGSNDYEAGGDIRDSLQTRKDKLIADRKTATEASRARYEAQPPMSVQKLQGFLNRPGFRRAMLEAGSSVIDEGNKPTTPYWDVEGAGAPAANPDGVPGIRMRVAALPPEVLDRIKGHLDDAVNKAPAGSRAQRSAVILRDQYRDLLDQQYPSTYPQTRADYAANSRPLDPLEAGKVGQALDSQTQFSNRTYTMPQERVAQSFLGSKALKSDYDNLIAAYGGDKKAALGNLEQNLANKVEGAINGDGTLSLDAFNRAIRPYTKALSMWFPDLSQKFATAEGAQRTLETLKTQKGLADDLTQGGMRDGDLVTKTSAMRWLSRNEKALGDTQSKAAVMRLRAIADALPENPGAGAEAAVEAAPMLAGGALGGLEGGVLGGITHNIPAYLAGPRMKAFRNAYSQAVEKAFTDPVEAQRLTTAAAKRGGTQALRKVLMDEAKKAALATPAAVNAGTPVAPQ